MLFGFNLRAIRYNNVTRDLCWHDHAQTVSAAAAVNSTLTGPSGVKMSGPYSWVRTQTLDPEPPTPNLNSRAGATLLFHP